MSLAKLLQSGKKLLEIWHLCAQHNPEEILVEEARRRQNEDDLFVLQLTDELIVVSDVLELLHLDLDHHVNSSRGRNGFEPWDLLDSWEDKIVVFSHSVSEPGEVLVRYLLQDSGEGIHDESVGVQPHHEDSTESSQNVIKETLVVVHNYPSKSPAWKTENLRNSAS